MLLLLLVSGCSALQQRDRTRTLQTQVIRVINDDAEKYAQCAKAHQLFNHTQEKKVRLEVEVKINSLGQIEEFKTDTTKFSNEFLNCIYTVLDKAKFPKLEENEVVHFKQPFIFSETK